MCFTGSIQPLYMANVGWWNHLRSFAFSIPRVKGDLEIWLNAFFITSVSTPLRERLLRFLRWRCSSLQEKDSLCGVLDLCRYIVSSSSLEKTSELEGDRFCCARWSCFFKSSISRCMALSSSCSWDTWPFLRKSLPSVDGMYTAFLIVLLISFVFKVKEIIQLMNICGLRLTRTYLMWTWSCHIIHYTLLIHKFFPQTTPIVGSQFIA